MKAKKEATVALSWCAEDVQTLRPRWPIDRCLEVLQKNRCALRDAMVEAGWHCLEEAVTDEEVGTC